MSYIAFLDSDNVVTQVVKTPDDSTDWAAVWSDRHNCQCIETCKDGSIRHLYGTPGHTYYEDIDAFMEPAPYSSWVLNKEVPAWEAPVPMPADSDEFNYVWDEKSVNWKNLGPVEADPVEPWFDLGEEEA